MRIREGCVFEEHAPDFACWVLGMEFSLKGLGIGVLP